MTRKLTYPEGVCPTLERRPAQKREMRHDRVVTRHPRSGSPPARSSSANTRRPASRGSGWGTNDNERNRKNEGTREQRSVTTDRVGRQGRGTESWGYGDVPQQSAVPLSHPPTPTSSRQAAWYRHAHLRHVRVHRNMCLRGDAGRDHDAAAQHGTPEPPRASHADIHRRPPPYVAVRQEMPSHYLG
jgi:hypothetical protein